MYNALLKNPLSMPLVNRDVSELSGSTQLRNVVESASLGLIEQGLSERSVGKKNHGNVNFRV